MTRVRQNAPVPQRARAELHAALIPAHHQSFSNTDGRCITGLRKGPEADDLDPLRGFGYRLADRIQEMLA